MYIISTLIKILIKFVLNFSNCSLHQSHL
jgi:hypothetical protein